MGEEAIGGEWRTRCDGGEASMGEEAEEIGGRRRREAIGGRRRREGDRWSARRDRKSVV